MKRISTVAQRLKEYREENDLTLADLEKKTGIPAQTLNRYELAQRIPKIDMAVEIAEKLGINPLWLQGYDVNEKTALDSKGDFNDPLIEQIMELVLQMSPEAVSYTHLVGGRVHPGMAALRHRGPWAALALHRTGHLECQPHGRLPPCTTRSSSRLMAACSAWSI